MWYFYFYLSLNTIHHWIHVQQILNPIDIFWGLKKEKPRQIRTVCIKGMIGIVFQHLIILIPTRGGRRFDTGGRVGWQSGGETNTAADRRGNTSGTFWDWGRGKTVPVVQSPPNLHQVSGIKESISALAFHVWLNHPGQCVRCWTKLILSKKKK